jgi:hypothetical protein
MILLPIGENNQEWHLVGPAYVHGIMALFDKSLTQDLEQQQFIIV